MDFGLRMDEVRFRDDEGGTRGSNMGHGVLRFQLL